MPIYITHKIEKQSIQKKMIGLSKFNMITQKKMIGLFKDYPKETERSLKKKKIV